MNSLSPYQAKLDAIPVTRESLTANGSRTELWIYGPDDADTTIVMVHGFRGDHHGLEPIVAQLGSYRCVLADLPGFGSSTPLSSRHDVEGYGRWLAELIPQLQVPGTRQTIVLGHSFGSIIVAGALAQGIPADGVVLINPIAAPALSGPRGVLTRLAVFYYWLAAKLPEALGFALLRNAAIVRVMSVTMAKTKDPVLRRWIHAQHDAYFSAFSNRDVVLEAFTASVGSDVSEFAAGIAPPTLLIAAAKDDITPVAAQHRLNGLITGSQLTVIPDVGHLIHYEVPEEAGLAIIAFIAGIAAAASTGEEPA
jgi:pimeloyl-ACP methyl ester carboxylesterase